MFTRASESNQSNIENERRELKKSMINTLKDINRWKFSIGGYLLLPLNLFGTSSGVWNSMEGGKKGDHKVSIGPWLETNSKVISPGNTESFFNQLNSHEEQLSVNVLWHSKYWFLPIDVFISVNKRPIWIISKLEYSLLTSQDARRDRYCFNSHWANFTSFPFGALDSWELPDHDTGTFDHYTGTSGHHKDPSSHMGVLQNITVSHVTTGTLSDVVVHTSRSTPY